MARTFQFQQPVVEFVAKLQDTATDTITSLLGAVGDNAPALPIDGAADMVTTAADLVDAGYGMVEELLTANRTFVAGLLTKVADFVAGLSTKADAKPAAPKAAAKKAPAKASAIKAA